MRCRACRRAALMLAVALSAGGMAHAADPGTTTTYRWVDAQGVIHFSDTPRPGAQRLEIPPAQTCGALPVPAADSTEQGEPPQGSAATSAYRYCLISQPSSDQAFYAPQSVEVQVQLSPSLRPSDQLTVRADGKPLPPKGDDRLVFSVPSPYRGAHTITAVVTDASGQPVCKAAPVTFYVRRPSLLSPLSPARSHGVQTVPSVPRVASPHR